MKGNILNNSLSVPERKFKKGLKINVFLKGTAASVLRW
jgi:hypothetical protein